MTERLLEGWCSDLAAGVGPHECDEQTRESVRRDADAPGLQGRAELGPLLFVEVDGPACSDGHEAVDDRVSSWDELEFREQYVSLAPADLDDLACDVDLHSVEPAGFHSDERTAGAIRVTERLGLSVYFSRHEELERNAAFFREMQLGHDPSSGRAHDAFPYLLQASKERDVLVHDPARVVDVVEHPGKTSHGKTSTPLQGGVRA